MIWSCLSSTAAEGIFGYTKVFGLVHQDRLLRQWRFSGQCSRKTRPDVFEERFVSIGLPLRTTRAL